MKIKIFNVYGGNMDSTKVQDVINDFIKDKEIIDIKVAGTSDEYGFKILQYLILYKEYEQ